MSRYASKTEVSPAKSRAEIEDTVTRYGATSFASGWHSDRAVIQFEMKGRRARFTLPMPDPKAKAFTEYTQRGKRWARTESAAAELYQQAVRQRWRALLLVVKAKLEAVEAGISVFEDEFMAAIVLPDGHTVGEVMREQIALAYRDGTMPPLLPDYSKGGSA